jgi:hypothetical protein
LGFLAWANPIAKEALLFEKRSKNFCYLSVRPMATAYLKKQKFFGSFFQKRTASLATGRPRATTLLTRTQ